MSNKKKSTNKSKNKKRLIEGNLLTFPNEFLLLPKKDKNEHISLILEMLKKNILQMHEKKEIDEENLQRLRELCSGKTPKDYLTALAPKILHTFPADLLETLQMMLLNLSNTYHFQKSGKEEDYEDVFIINERIGIKIVEIMKQLKWRKSSNCVKILNVFPYSNVDVMRYKSSEKKFLEEFFGFFLPKENIDRLFESHCVKNDKKYTKPTDLDYNEYSNIKGVLSKKNYIKKILKYDEKDEKNIHYYTSQLILGNYTQRGRDKENALQTKKCWSTFCIEYLSGYQPAHLNMEKKGLLKIKCKFRIFRDGMRN